MNFISARQAWHDAYTIFDKSPGMNKVRVDFGQKDADWKIVDGCEAGKVQAVVGKLKPILRSWGMYAYTPRFTAQDEKRILNHVHAQYARKYHLPTSRDGMARMLILESAALKDKAYNERNGGRLWSQADLAREIGIIPPNYSRDWAHIYERMLRILDDLPPRALGPVYQLVSEMRERVENPPIDS